MVYAFFVGMFVGLPVGCYMREAGYAQKVRNAYNIFVSPPEANKLSQLKGNSPQEFYDNIKKGLADPADFERYIYGGTYAKRSKDDSDKNEEAMKKVMQDILK